MDDLKLNAYIKNTISVSYETETPTGKQYIGLQEAYTFFNNKLFDNKLPECLITFQRHHGSKAYFSPNKFENKINPQESRHEIALNPSVFPNRTQPEILSSLVHEMCHLWQEENGNPSRGNYHNGEWADKMESIGLMPSQTGEPGGNRVGQGMTHYILDTGLFTKECKKLLKKEITFYQDKNMLQGFLGIPGGPMPGITGLNGKTGKITIAAKKKNKIKYTCSGCGLNVWGKPGINVKCEDCDRHLTEGI